LEQGIGGQSHPELARSVLSLPHRYPDGYRSVLLWLYTAEKCFSSGREQPDSQNTKPVEILIYLKKTFPSVERITTYSRAKTVAFKKVEELRELHDAGLSRIHIGLESGYDPLLEFMQKGVTARDHIEAGRKVKESGISLSEYIMPGLGGKTMWKQHAVETAKVLNQINPDFIRIRTLKALRIMPLYRKIESGELVLLSDDEIVAEKGF